jgi:hypothetical protein
VQKQSFKNFSDFTKTKKDHLELTLMGRQLTEPPLGAALRYSGHAAGGVCTQPFAYLHPSSRVRQMTKPSVVFNYSWREYFGPVFTKIELKEKKKT